MAHLVSYYTQIAPNLRRTASKGLISLLNQKQLEELAFKHFSCINTETGQIGYRCPYTGIEFYNYEDIILEHIIPVSSMGGSVLFNCIPAYKGINGSDEKGAKHLLDWWKDKGKQYYTPERLDKLLSYMFDAYDIVFANHTIEEIENSYEDIDLDENIFKEYYNTEQNDDNSEDINELSKEVEELKKQAKKTGVISYLGFINNCLDELRENNYDTTKYEEKLKEYAKYGYFENIERYTLFQNTLKDIVENMLGDKKTGLLSYTINFNISKLMDSMKEYESKEDIKNELEKRITNIDRILQENNLSTIEYFKSLRDIQDIDILYKNINEITSDELRIFLENIKLGIDSKIDIFINMLNQGNSEILKDGNKETLEGYPFVKLAYFWSNYQNRIKPLIFETLKDDSSYNIARQTILDKYDVHNYEELIAKQKIWQDIRSIDLDTKINIFINMLNQGNSAILKQGNDLTLEGYPFVKLASFWHSYQDRIIPLLFEILKDDSSYDIARQTILDKYDVRNYEELINKQGLSTEEMIKIYIKMLNQGNSAILKQRNDLTLEGYSFVKLASFWNNNQDKIITLLFETLKDDSSYDIARQTILDKYDVRNYEELINKQGLSTEEMIKIYIKMLNQGNSKILDRDNNEFLEGYPGVKLASFWTSYQDRIIPLLFETLKDDSSYDIARQTILDKYDVHNYEELINKQKNRQDQHALSLDIKINCFINMLNQGNSAILKQRNDLTLEGYSFVKLASFWTSYQDKIISLLFETLKDDSSYDIARQTILDKYDVHNYEELIAKQKDRQEKFDIPLDTKIDIFINMLNQGNSKILDRDNNEFLEGYPSVKLASFWHNHQDRIIPLLFETLKDDSSYDIARQTILDKYDVHNYEELIDKQKNRQDQHALSLDIKMNCFINMLNQGNSAILKQGNDLTLEGYPSVKLASFWTSYQDRIIPLLFETLKDDSSYDIARQTILNYKEVHSYKELEFSKKENLHLRIACFIKMINNGNKEILKSTNKEFFYGYQEVPVRDFWNREKNREIIIKILFERFRNISIYDTARRLILENLKVKTIEEYYEKIEMESKKMKDNKKIKKQLEETIRLVETYQLLDGEEHRKRA